jgi:RNA polymerase sigma-70 factor (ECF subfamily)
MMICTDEELVKRHLNGDEQAFNELVERYSSSIYNLAYRILLDRAEAEDIVQDTFLRAYLALPHSHTERPFRPWVITIALNACRSALRKKRPLLFAEVTPQDEDEDEFIDTLPSESKSPAEVMETEELESLLRQAVAALPEEERMILTLRYNENLSYEQIGELLQIPTGTVGTHLYRAKRHLYAAISDNQEVNS